MILTDKCKVDFEQWFNYNPHYVIGKIDLCDFELDEFYDLTPSMQWGVLVDYFDSVGIEIWIKPNVVNYVVYITSEKGYLPYLFNTRQEARDKAIEKANTIYNE